MVHHISRVVKKTAAAIALLSIEFLVVAILFISSFFLFLAIARMVFLEHKEAFDQACFNFLSQHVNGLNDSVMLGFTFMGNPEFMIPANVLLLGYFAFIEKHKWYSIKIPAIAITSLIVMSGLKDVFNRTRPLDPLLYAARGLSFPSGHALTSVTFYGLLIYIVWERVKNRVVKSVIITLLVLLILTIGFSRVYLRVHYMSDVIAGFCLGTLWLVIAIWSLRKIERFTHKKIDPIVKEEKPAVS